jgi:hypothetical protein
MKKEFDMIDLSLMKYFLEMEVDQSAHGIFLCEQKYSTNIFKMFRMDKCKPTETPIELGTKMRKQEEVSIVDSALYKRLVGSLMSLTATRPNIMYASSLFSRFMESPKDSHWKVEKKS